MEYVIKVSGNIIQIEVSRADKKKCIEVIKDLTLKRSNETWQSIHNSYITYDYEPFNELEFKYSAELEFANESKAKFARYLLSRYLERIVHLETCFKVDSLKMEVN